MRMIGTRKASKDVNTVFRQSHLCSVARCQAYGLTIVVTFFLDDAHVIPGPTFPPPWLTRNAYAFFLRTDFTLETSLVREAALVAG